MKNKNADAVVDKNLAHSKKNSFLSYFKQHKWLYIMLIPGALYFIIFRYIPMGGIIIAFKQYSPFRGIWESPWVGFKQFQLLFSGTDFWLLLKNTLALSLMNLVFYFPMPIIIALLLNEIKNQIYKRVIQTFIYIPHFVSWVIVASLTFTLFNVTDGAINGFVKSITGKTINFLGLPEYFRPLIIGQVIWKETGYGTIIFLAALAGVDPNLYEAAKVDGAGRWKIMWHITLPALKGTIIMMLILRVGSILNTGFEQIYLMRNDLNLSASEVFDTFVYQRGIINGQFSYSSAAGLFKSIVGLILVLSADRLAKKAGESGIY
ncbi:MAG: sugar ABC transporter permease [Treponemataceae bacterium]|nr:sugar ABC transporter permease [Treponemataceae bacterium]